MPPLGEYHFDLEVPRLTVAVGHIGQLVVSRPWFLLAQPGFGPFKTKPDVLMSTLYQKRGLCGVRRENGTFSNLAESPIPRKQRKERKSWANSRKESILEENEFSVS